MANMRNEDGFVERRRRSDQRGPQGERGKTGHSSVGEWVRWAITMVAVGITLLNTLALHEQDTKIAQAVSAIIVQRCNSENQLRSQLTDLVKGGQDNTRAYFKRGLITKAEYKETLQDQAAAIKVLRPRDCEALVNEFQRQALNKKKE